MALVCAHTAACWIGSVLTSTVWYTAGMTGTSLVTGKLKYSAMSDTFTPRIQSVSILLPVMCSATIPNWIWARSAVSSQRPAVSGKGHG